MAKTNSKKKWVSVNIIQPVIKQIAEIKITTTKRELLQKARQGKMLYVTEGDKNSVRGFKEKILKRVSISVLGEKRGSRISGVLMKHTNNNSPLNLFIESTLAVALSSSRGILNNLTKADLISPLVDSGVASLEAGYLLIRGRVNKRGALNHIINEASGSISSGVSVLGTLAVLRALAYIPTPGRIAVLIVAKIAIKKLQNRR